MNLSLCACDGNKTYICRFFETKNRPFGILLSDKLIKGKKLSLGVNCKVDTSEGN